MLDFQREPEPVKVDPRCEKCHQIVLKTVKTSDGDPYCHHCGHIFGTSVEPATWACEECGEIILGLADHLERPWCGDCKVPMSCLTARSSRVHGAGTGDEDMEFGLAFLMEAQGENLDLGSDILRDSQQ